VQCVVVEFVVLEKRYKIVVNVKTMIANAQTVSVYQLDRNTIRLARNANDVDL
jgi:hypothetical protein